MSETNEIKLKPCPFCGGKAESGTLRTSDGVKFLVECSNCGVATLLYYDTEKAAGAWNRRVN